MVEQAFALVGNISFVNVLVYVSPGHDVQSLAVTEEGHGGEEKALIREHDFNSYQKSPKWTGSPVVSIQGKFISSKAGSDVGPV